MSQIEVERFLGRLMTDQNFRKRVSSSLESATSSEGMVLSSMERSILGSIDVTRFNELSDSLDESIKRAC